MSRFTACIAPRRSVDAQRASAAEATERRVISLLSSHFSAISPEEPSIHSSIFRLADPAAGRTSEHDGFLLEASILTRSNQWRTYDQVSSRCLADRGIVHVHSIGPNR